MGRSTVRVVARLRPTDYFASGSLKLADDQKTVTVHSSKRAAGDTVNNAVEDHGFKLDAVFRDASQEAMFDLCAADIVKSVLLGYNGSVMAYGQTGAGKTYTMMGGADYRTRGILPRAIKAVFDDVSSQVDRSFQVRVSFVEVYNDKLVDLLAPNSGEDLSVQEDAGGAVTIKGASHVVCTNEAEALSYVFTGNGNRVIAEHALNAQSSRSHTVFTLHVTSRSRVESESASLVGKLHCIDLAGSERLSKTESGGKTMKEAQYINKSLTFLEQVVMALSSSSRAHVPFRQSKLTNILKDSLGGNSKTTMVANLWPEERHLEESLSTLKFALRMMRVQTDATVNAVLDPETHIKQLQRKIADLKAELQMQNQLSGKSHVQYEGDFTEDERFEMEKTVQGYVAGRTPDISVRSLRDVKEYFRIFRALTDSREVAARAAIGDPDSPAAPAAAKGKAAAVGAQEAAPKGLGTVDPSTGLAIGVAAPAVGLKDALNPRSPERLAPGAPGGVPTDAVSMARGTTAGGAGDDESLPPVGARQTVINSGAGPDRNAAFAEYKATEGGKAVVQLRDLSRQLAAKKQLCVQSSGGVNQAKEAIDGATAALAELRREKEAVGQGDAVDDQEYRLGQDLKEAKAAYRQAYDDLTVAKTARDHLTKRLDAGQQQLLLGFNQWFDKTYGAGDGPALGAMSGRAAGAVRTMRAQSVAALEPHDGDALDEGERFELLERHRVMEEDPDSIAFFEAKKMTTTRKQHSTRRARR